MSMIGLSLLAKLTNVIATTKHSDPMATTEGINIILFDDYMSIGVDAGACIINLRFVDIPTCTHTIMVRTAARRARAYLRVIENRRVGSVIALKLIQLSFHPSSCHQEEIRN